MEKYSIVIPKCGNSMLLKGCLRSINENLNPDEIIIVDQKFKYSKFSEQSGPGMNIGYKAARNNLILSLDMDTLVTSPKFIEKLMEAIKPDDVFCATGEWWLDKEIKMEMYSAASALVKKDKYLQTCGYSGTGQPSWCVNMDVKKKGWKTAFVDVGPYWFHMTKCNKTTYYHGLPDWLNRKLNGWCSEHGYDKDEVYNKYYINTGMDKVDLEQLNYAVLEILRTRIARREPFSTMRLGDLGMRSLKTYVVRDGSEHDQKEFVRLNVEHPDLALPNREEIIRLTEELIKSLNEADFIDHPKLYKGTTGKLYNWRGILKQTDEVYKTLGIRNNKYCHSLQGYLAFVKDFETNMYQIMKGRKILYVGPWNELKSLNERKDLRCKELGYYELSMARNHYERVAVMEKFFDTYKPNDWDLVIVTGSLYGRVIIGRIKRLGGRAFDMGQAVNFNPNNVFDTTVIPIENKTFYELADDTKDNIFDSYKDMQKQKVHVFKPEQIATLLNPTEDK